jgi:predicted O-methyltransferase YrrM
VPNILYAPVEQYLDGLLPRRDAVLAEMEGFAKRHHVPIVGPAVGRLLALITEMTGAKRIFEMGSAFGYSTIWLARAAGPRAKVYYTDWDPENARRAEGYFRRAGVSRRIRVLGGDALELLRREKGPFDIIFCDVEKHQYPESLRIALPRLKRGGLLIADNTLWYGRVARRADTKDTLGIQTFNKMVYASRKLYPVILPLRDGVSICRKR